VEPPRSPEGEGKHTERIYTLSKRKGNHAERKPYRKERERKPYVKETFAKEKGKGKREGNHTQRKP
jgi:hypothetical protein